MYKQQAITIDHHDKQQLTALGYSSNFSRNMSFWQNFALGFTYLSPVAGIYTVFGSCFALGGPPMVWSLVLAGLGQMLVALIFGEIVSQYPLAGGIYPWARRLYGKKWAWMSGWIYMMALFSTIAGVAYGAAPYISYFLAIPATMYNSIVGAFVILLIATIINFMGTKTVAKMAMFGFIAELVGALIVSGYLILFQRHHDLTVFFHSFGVEKQGSYLAAFTAASLLGIFQYYGFEACADVAEEVKNPGKQIPKAMRYTLYIGGMAATFLCVALILSVKDFQSVFNGLVSDPVSALLDEAFGPVIAHIVIGVVLISFLSCTMSLQTAASRLVYSYARDKMIIGSHLFSTFSKGRHIPPYALLLSVLVPLLVIMGSMVSTKALDSIVSFSSIGMYIAFQMIIFAALRARLKGWQPAGEYRLGKWGMPVNIGALIYGISAIVVISWPRTPDVAWYDNWIVLLSAGLVIAIGGLYLLFARSQITWSDAPYADAVPDKQIVWNKERLATLG